MQLYPKTQQYQCTDYTVPITLSTIGYLQFYLEFTANNLSDIDFLKVKLVDAETGNFVFISPLNLLVKEVSIGNYVLLASGFDFSQFAFKTFYFEFSIKECLNCNERLFVSNLFQTEPCVNATQIQACVSNGQKDSIFGSLLLPFEPPFIYLHWQTASIKKYTPIIFLRNVSFRKNSTTIEFKKLNNRPLKTISKHNFNFQSEPIPLFYNEQIEEVFAFGKVEVLGKKYFLENYNLQIIDEKDCCSKYEIKSIATEEYNLRLNCDNNCTILSPIDCFDFIVPKEFINITMLASQTELDITDLVILGTGFDGSELSIFNNLFNNCYFLEFNDNRLFLYRKNTETICSSLFLPYTVCGQNVGVTINLTFETAVTCFTNMITSITFANNLHTIDADILSETFLEYSLNNVTWIRVSGTFAIGNSIVTNLLPTGTIFIRLVSVCNELFISNVLNFNSNTNNNLLIGGISQTDFCENNSNVICYFQLQTYNLFQINDLIFNAVGQTPFVGQNLNYNVFINGYSSNVVINNQGVITAINFVC